MGGSHEFKIEMARVVFAEYEDLNDNLEISYEAGNLDSMGITEICFLIEDHFNIEISFDDIKGVKTYGNLREMIRKKGGEI